MFTRAVSRRAIVSAAVDRARANAAFRSGGKRRQDGLVGSLRESRERGKKYPPSAHTRYGAGGALSGNETETNHRRAPIPPAISSIRGSHGSRTERRSTSSDKRVRKRKIGRSLGNRPTLSSVPGPDSSSVSFNVDSCSLVSAMLARTCCAFEPPPTYLRVALGLSTLS